MSDIRKYLSEKFLIKPNNLAIYELALTHPSCNS